MITQAESVLHLCGAAAISVAMLGVGLGALGPRGRRGVRPLWLVAGVLGGAMTMWVANVELRFSTSSSLPLVGLGCLIALVVGAAITRVGWRGRRVGEHEHCGRCGFDLTGRPATSNVCAECGAPLDASGAIVVGVLERRRGPLLAGQFVALLALAVGGVAARDAAGSPGGFSMARYKPTSWLIDDYATSRGRATGFAAGWELYRRATTGGLTGGAALRTARAAFADLTNRNSPLAGSGSTPFGRAILSALWVANALDDASIRQLIRENATLEFGARGRGVQPGATTVPFGAGMDRLAELAQATGPTGAAGWSISVVSRTDTVGGRAPAAVVGAAGIECPPNWVWAAVSGQVSSAFGDEYRLDAPLPDEGRVPMSLAARVAVTVTPPGRSPITEEVQVLATADVPIIYSAIGYRRRTPTGRTPTTRAAAGPTTR